MERRAGGRTPVQTAPTLPQIHARLQHSETGFAEDNAVFYTEFGRDRGPEFWVVARYEPCRAIEFIRMSPGVRISRLDIHLAADGPQGTVAVWTQTLTALSPEGNSYIDRYGLSSYSQEIKVLEELLNHYLKTGCMSPMPGH